MALQISPCGFARAGAFRSSRPSRPLAARCVASAAPRSQRGPHATSSLCSGLAGPELRSASRGGARETGRAPAPCRALISYLEVTAGNDAPEDLSVEVHPTEAAVGARICQMVVSAAQSAVAERGVFLLAIPGGSVLKMCAGLAGLPVPWDKTLLFYVNHKCVPAGDKASTHQKALDYFLTRVGAPLANVVALKGSADAPAEAREYEARLRQVAMQHGTALTADVVPRLDLVLLGMGADGHVGSLYPGRPETGMAGPGTPLVLPVDKKQPASITLSLPVMCAARQVVVAMTGGGKAEAVRAALQSTGGAATDMPARRVRPVEGGSAVWLMDAPAAAQLDVAAGARALLAADIVARAL